MPSQAMTERDGGLVGRVAERAKIARLLADARQQRSGAPKSRTTEKNLQREDRPTGSIDRESSYVQRFRSVSRRS